MPKMNGLDCSQRYSLDITLVVAEEAAVEFLEVEQAAAVVAFAADIGCRDMPEALVRSCLSLVCQQRLYQQSQECRLQLLLELEL